MIMKYEAYEAPTAEIIELGDTITTNLTFNASGTGLTTAYGANSEVDDFTNP